MTEYGMLLTDLDTELFIEIFDELRRAKTKKVTSFHSPSSYNPKIFSEDVNPHNISISGSFISDVVLQGRKLEYFAQIEDDVLFVYFDRDIATYLLLSKGAVAGYENGISDDLFSIDAKIKGQLLGQVREAVDDRCTTDGSEVTDTDAMRDKAIQLIPTDLTVSAFQANAATGTAGTPANINDNIEASSASYSAADKYCEINFGAAYRLNNYRYFGDAAHDEDGTYKIQYYNYATDAWSDWITGISTRLNSWSSWIADTVIITTKVRIVATAIDGLGLNMAHEWEMKYV